MKKPLIEPRLIGRRFDDHTIPLEVLKDLSVLEEFIIAVAKWLYVQDHGRIRSPKGFASALSIALSGVRDGSAIPSIAFSYDDGTEGLLPAANEEYFVRATECIGRAIDAAIYKENITQHVPTALLGYFDRFGRSLRDGESLELFPGNIRKGTLTKPTRRLLLLASQNQIITDEIVIRGMVPEINQNRMSFEIQVPGGRKIDVKMDAVHLDTILEATNGYRNSTKISVKGVGRYDRTSRLQSIESIEEVVIIDMNDPLARIDELRLLKDGWLEGIGLAPKASDLDWLEHFFSERFPSSCYPFIYPTEEGGVQLEWESKTHDISIRLDFRRKAVEVHDLSSQQEEDWFEEFSLEDNLKLEETINKSVQFVMDDNK